MASDSSVNIYHKAVDVPRKRCDEVPSKIPHVLRHLSP